MESNKNGIPKKSSSVSSLLRKPKPPPLVRQTLTSKYRMLKANPLLIAELEKKANPENEEKAVFNKPLKTLAKVFDNCCIENSFSNSTFYGSLNNCSFLTADKSLPSKSFTSDRNKTFSENVKPKITHVTKSATVSKNLPFKKPIDFTKSVNKQTMPLKAIDNNKTKQNVTQNTTTNQNKLQQKGIHNVKIGPNKNVTKLIDEKEKKDQVKVQLKTDKNLQNDEGKENETPQKINIKIDFSDDAEDSIFNSNKLQVAQEALLDLYQLIQDGHPLEQCEKWLKLIKDKYNQIEEKAEYWECRAALEQIKGNVRSAVDCYKNAIIQGAEVATMEERMDQLLKKFTLLHIDNSKENSNNNENVKMLNEIRDIFTSTVIQFAVLEKKMKKKCKEEKQLFATPVRRSTRLSQSVHVMTPGVKIYSSLNEVESPIREKLNFQYNKALKE